MKSIRVPPWLWTLVRIFVSIGLIGWLAQRYNWAAVWAALRGIPMFVVCLSFWLMLAAQGIGARRLQLLLAAQGICVHYGYIMRLNFAGLFAGNYLPSTVGGDALKMILLTRSGVKKSAAALSLVADRLISMISMMFFSPFILYVAEIFHIEMDTKILILIGVVFGATTILVAGFVFFLYQRDLSTANNHQAWMKKSITFIKSLFALIRIWTSRPGTLFLAFALSAGVISCIIFAGWLLLVWGLATKIGLIEYIAVIILAYFISVLPISINGLGLQEASFVYLLSLFGVAAEQSLTFAVLVRLLNLVISLPGGVILWFGVDNIRIHTTNEG